MNTKRKTSFLFMAVFIAFLLCIACICYICTQTPKYSTTFYGGISSSALVIDAPEIQTLVSLTQDKSFSGVENNNVIYDTVNLLSQN